MCSMLKLNCSMLDSSIVSRNVEKLLSCVIFLMMIMMRLVVGLLMDSDELFSSVMMMLLMMFDMSLVNGLMLEVLVILR